VRPRLGGLLLSACVIVPPAAIARTAPGEPAGGTDDPKVCSRVAFTEPRPLWVYSLAWSRDGAHLLVPDPMREEVFVFDREGSLKRRLRIPVSGDLEVIRPGAIRSNGEGLFLQADLRVLNLDDGGEPIGAADLGARVFPGHQQVRTLFDWSADGTWVYSFSDVLQAGGSWRSGWYRFTAAGESRLELLREVPIESPEGRFYTVGHPHAVVEGLNAYLLVMDRVPFLLEVSRSGQRRLRAFPPGFGKRPVLPRVPGVDEDRLVFAAIERATMPAGLHALDGRLYVLTRRPGEAGTVWEVTGIDPAADRVVSRVRLPTSAPHLVAAPGREHWALVEKGTFESVGRQQVLGLLFVPAGWVAGTSGSATPPPGCE